MIKAKKILFVAQEMTPYVSESTLAALGRKVPQATQENKKEIRTFMPKWGHINERRNQLHEVIRLSGMNLVVDDTDHTLVIKVASIPSARMQVYFIDNDDFFTKRKMGRDDKGQEYKDNAERAAFFARGVLETVKKLRWTPDVIHCQGWMSSFIPVYLKEAYTDEPALRDCRIVYTPADEELKAPLPDNINGILNFNGIGPEALEGTDSKCYQQYGSFCQTLSLCEIPSGSYCRYTCAYFIFHSLTVRRNILSEFSKRKKRSRKFVLRRY